MSENGRASEGNDFSANIVRRRLRVRCGSLGQHYAATT